MRKKETAAPEEMVRGTEIMRIYKFKKSYLNDAKNSLGLPFYEVGGIKYRISEVEEWVQQRRRTSSVGR